MRRTGAINFTEIEQSRKRIDNDLIVFFDRAAPMAGPVNQTKSNWRNYRYLPAVERTIHLLLHRNHRYLIGGGSLLFLEALLRRVALLSDDGYS